MPKQLSKTYRARFDAERVQWRGARAQGAQGLVSRSSVTWWLGWHGLWLGEYRQAGTWGLKVKVGLINLTVRER